MSKEDIEVVAEKSAEDGKTDAQKERKFSWEAIIEDASIVKICAIKWKEQDIELKYRELVGYEDLEIEKKYGEDVARASSEKVFLMLQKGNPGDETDMTRERWERIPSRLRNTIILTIIFSAAKDFGGGQDFLPLLKERMGNSLAE